MSRDPDNPLGLSASILEEVDDVCWQFEHAWLQKERPKILEYVTLRDGDARLVLLHELILLDIEYRTRSGEQPTPAEYRVLFPHQNTLIESAFAATRPQETIDGRQNQAMISTENVLPPDERPLPGQLGRYRILDQVGFGGFGTVYKAHDEQLHRDVAVKVPHRHRFRCEAAMDVFLNEARLLATLRHPGIVPVYDVGFTEGDTPTCYVVSQFMDGGDLAEYAADTRPSTREAAQIVIRVAEALHYAHGRGLVHRDVKLSNILRDADGNVYIADFGLALRDEDVGSGVGYAGTPANMSPEQARGEAHLVDGRTDIYGLGVVLYELLTGVRPFDNPNVSKLLEQIVLREPKPPRQTDELEPAFDGT